MFIATMSYTYCTFLDMPDFMFHFQARSTKSISLKSGLQHFLTRLLKRSFNHLLEEVHSLYCTMSTGIWRLYLEI